MPWNQIYQDIEAEKAYNFCQCGIINIREIEKNQIIVLTSNSYKQKL